MTTMLGYARASTRDQDPALQIDALAAAGCERVFTEVASGTREDRPQLAAVLDHLYAGHTLVVWKLDRLGRSLRHLIDSSTSSLALPTAAWRSAASKTASIPPPPLGG